MATKPAMTSEAIALTEKKMDMTLDDIIKLSKKPSPSKPSRVSRVPNKSRGFLNSGASQGNSSKVQRFMNSRSSIRQGVLAPRRSNFQANQFPVATEVARKAAVAPIRNRAPVRNRVVNWNKPRVVAAPNQRKVAEGSFAGRVKMMVQKQRPQTLDSLFANMKEQRLRVLSQQQQQQQQVHGGGQNAKARLQGGVHQRRRRGGRSAGGAGSYGNFQ
ncbi:uncharacterized protein LOC143890477 [Tasmannia lanceolata]|uniref:uncharacterized protein LOC143890477 n=1 Tax=Tasmannia lanceolata TaxID=3420 RepID=UPI0040635BF2